MMPTVYNKRDGLNHPGAVYVGRPSKWGNPFVVGKDGTREEVVAKHKVWVLERITSGELDIQELTGRDLVCWCAPQPCHADTLLELASKE